MFKLTIFKLLLICLYRLTITANCPMNLQYFPLDRQLCYIEIESCKDLQRFQFKGSNYHEKLSKLIFMSEQVDLSIVICKGS